MNIILLLPADHQLCPVPPTDSVGGGLIIRVEVEVYLALNVLWARTTSAGGANEVIGDGNEEC
jgi:hypothetical protein